MSTVVRHTAAVGPVAPEVAWERFADLTRWADWAPQIVAVESDRTTLAVGVRGTVRAVGGVPVPFVVTAVDHDARTWSWIVRPLGLAMTLGLTMTLSHTVAAHPDGTRTTLAVEGSWPVVTAYAPLAHVALTRLVRADPIGDPVGGPPEPSAT